MSERRTFNRRQHERFALAAMYTSVEAQPRGAVSQRPLLGHAYDVSEGGVRLELDDALPRGEHIDLRISLPGEQRAVHAHGEVVWSGDVEDDPGPRRMALRFTSFQHDDDHGQLVRFLGRCPSRAAA